MLHVHSEQLVQLVVYHPAHLTQDGRLLHKGLQQLKMQSFKHIITDTHHCITMVIHESVKDNHISDLCILSHHHVCFHESLTFPEARIISQPERC